MVLTNCALMGIPPSEAGRLTLWEYQALLWNWNEAHKPEDETRNRLDPAKVRAQLDAINAANRTPATPA